MIAYNSEQ